MVKIIVHILFYTLHFGISKGPTGMGSKFGKEWNGSKNHLHLRELLFIIIIISINYNQHSTKAIMRISIRIIGCGSADKMK